MKSVTQVKGDPKCISIKSMYKHIIGSLPYEITYGYLFSLGQLYLPALLWTKWIQQPDPKKKNIFSFSHSIKPEDSVAYNLCFAHTEKELTDWQK